MRVKEKLCKASISKIKKRLKKLEFIMKHDHLADWKRCQDEGLALLKSDKKYSEVSGKVDSLEKEAEVHFKRVEVKHDEKHLNELVTLERELIDLENELFLMGARK